MLANRLQRAVDALDKTVCGARIPLLARRFNDETVLDDGESH